MAFPEKVDYVIIGAGIHGLSTAWHLAAKLKAKGKGDGSKIVVIDKETEAWKQAPFWVSLGVWGIRIRKIVMIFEILCVVVALAVSFIDPT